MALGGRVSLKRLPRTSDDQSEVAATSKKSLTEAFASTSGGKNNPRFGLISSKPKDDFSDFSV